MPPIGDRKCWSCSNKDFELERWWVDERTELIWTCSYCGEPQSEDEVPEDVETLKDIGERF